MDELTTEAARAVNYVAEQVAAKFTGYVEPADVKQELYLYYAANIVKFDAWSAIPADQFRVLLALNGYARKYCEIEKAAISGYEFDDLHWYDPTQLLRLLPLAYSEGWDGLSGEVEDAGQPAGRQVLSESGSLIAMVIDVRSALHGSKFKLNDFDPDSETGMANLEWLVTKLGGRYPATPGNLPRKRAA